MKKVTELLKHRKEKKLTSRLGADAQFLECAKEEVKLKRKMQRVSV